MSEKEPANPDSSVKHLLKVKAGGDSNHDFTLSEMFPLNLPASFTLSSKFPRSIPPLPGLWMIPSIASELSSGHTKLCTDHFLSSILPYRLCPSFLPHKSSCRSIENILVHFEVKNETTVNSG